MKPVSILGLDVSKKRIGAALVDHHTNRILDASTHTISTDPNELTNRLDTFTRIATHTNRRTTLLAVFIEDGFLVRHTGMLASLYAIGHIEAWATQKWRGTLIDRIKPATWRTTLNLQAHGKDDPLFYAREHFHHDTNTHLATHLNVNRSNPRTSGEQDAADAICIALAGRALLWRGGVE